jgi:hypothetical protein
MRLLSFLSWPALAVFAASLVAQDYGPRDAFMWNGYGGYHHASTAEEGALRGMGDLTRSVGAANLMNSEAAINMETARKEYISNRSYATETYFNMREMNRQAREAARGPRPTQEDAARYAAARTPQRLSPSELDPLTGDIDWPSTLRDPAYADPKSTLEKAFDVRAKNGYLTADQRAAVKKHADELLAMLKSDINAYSPQDYVNAKKFVEGLQYELYAGSG